MHTAIYNLKFGNSNASENAVKMGAKLNTPKHFIISFIILFLKKRERKKNSS